MSDYKVFTGCYDKSCRFFLLVSEWTEARPRMTARKNAAAFNKACDKVISLAGAFRSTSSPAEFSAERAVILDAPFPKQIHTHFNRFQRLQWLCEHTHSFQVDDNNDEREQRICGARTSSSNGTANVFQSFLASGIGWTRWWSHPEVVHSDKESNVVSVFTLSVGIHLQIIDWWLSFTSSWWNEMDSNTNCHTLFSWWSQLYSPVFVFQAVLTAHTLVPAASERSHAPLSPPDASHVRQGIRRRQSPGMPVLAPKPPRDAQTAHCLHR